EKAERRLRRHDDDADDASGDDDRRRAHEAHAFGIALEAIARALEAIAGAETAGRPAMAAAFERRRRSAARPARRARPRRRFQPLETRLRDAQKRLRERLAAARDHAAVVEQDEERMLVARVLLADVLREVRLRIALEKVREVERHGQAEATRRSAGQR